MVPAGNACVHCDVAMVPLAAAAPGVVTGGREKGLLCRINCRLMPV